MKHNALQNVIHFIFKYIWIFCCLLILVEIISTTYTSAILVQKTSEGVLNSTSGEISGRVDGVLRLITGLTLDPRFNDTAQPVYDRIIQAKSFQDSYNLYMIAMADEKVNVVSADETERPVKYTNLAHREYMQELFKTGEYQITDAFPSGFDSSVLNYTIAVPILKDGTAKGCIFGSIYFDEIVAIIERNQKETDSSFFLYGKDNTVMYGADIDEYGSTLEESTSYLHLFGTDTTQINADFTSNTSNSCWGWDKNGLSYFSYKHVSPADWMLVYQVPLISVVKTMLPALAVKILFYMLICLAVSILGRRYINKQLASVNHLIERVSNMQRILFHSEQTDYEGLLELTQQGLTDQLTDLATRAVLFKKMSDLLNEEHKQGAILFIDLDDLKKINDYYGHEAGDCALIYFAKALKRCEERYNGIASRYGGDEFILVLDNLTAKEIPAIAESLCKELNTTLQIKDKQFSIHGCIGISYYPQHGATIEELICKADLALYNAKGNGKNQCAEYDGL